jgi:hypothetical protein
MVYLLTLNFRAKSTMVKEPFLFSNRISSFKFVKYQSTTKAEYFQVQELRADGFMKSRILVTGKELLMKESARAITEADTNSIL